MHVLLRLDADGHRAEHDVWLTRTEHAVAVEVDGETHEATVERTADGGLVVHLGDERFAVELLDDHTARVGGHATRFRLLSFAPGGAPGEHETVVQGAGVVHPPMPGKIVRVDVAEGDVVEQGDTVAVLEAMKMQSEIAAPRSGTVVRVGVAVGDAVDARDVVCEIVSGEDAPS